MFGIMQQPLCKKSNDINSHRFNYCGTCKSIGSTYGNVSRMFLNYDIVFLSAILNNLSENTEYHSSYYNTSCISLPQQKSIPAVFEYVAALNVFLAGIKISDNIRDESYLKKITWQTTNSLFKNKVRQAKEYLNSLSFPIAKTENLLKQNSELELNVNLSLETYVSPTSNITGMTFSFGAKLVGLEKAAIQLMHQIGKLFGELVFLKDTVDDYGEDKINNNFNPIIKSNIITFGSVKKLFNSKNKILQAKIDELEIPQNVRNRYISQLQTLNYTEENKDKRKSKSSGGCFPICDVSCCVSECCACGGESCCVGGAECCACC